MNEKAFEKVERDLNLATGEVKITEEMINLDRFRITSESEIQPKEYTMEFLGSFLGDRVSQGRTCRYLPVWPRRARPSSRRY